MAQNSWIEIAQMCIEESVCRKVWCSPHDRFVAKRGVQGWSGDPDGKKLVSLCILQLEKLPQELCIVCLVDFEKMCAKTQNNVTPSKKTIGLSLVERRKPITFQSIYVQLKSSNAFYGWLLFSCFFLLTSMLVSACFLTFFFSKVGCFQRKCRQGTSFNTCALNALGKSH